MFKTILAAAAVLLLTACSTTVKETTPGGAPAATGQALSVRSVKGAASATVPGDLVTRLTLAIQSETGAASSGRPVNLEFNVVEYREVSGAARALGGMLAGSNHLKASVTLRDPSGGVVRQFDVERKSNPGGLGAITDQEQGLVNATAKAIAQALSK